MRKYLSTSQYVNQSIHRVSYLTSVLSLSGGDVHHTTHSVPTVYNREANNDLQPRQQHTLSIHPLDTY